MIYLYTIERFGDRISKAEIIRETNIAFIIKDISSMTGKRAMPRDRNSFLDLESAIIVRNKHERERLVLRRKDYREQELRCANITAWTQRMRNELL